MASPHSVEEYLSELPEEARTALEKVRSTIKAAAPDTIETISYQMPTFKYRNRALVGIAGFKEHCSLFPYSKGVMEVLKEDLEPYDTASKGATIRFSPKEPLPDPLIEKIVRARMQEIDERASS
jgi:uncharacterized protein YdhG (YjbR/CyaY superfamily)